MANLDVHMANGWFQEVGKLFKIMHQIMNNDFSFVEESRRVPDNYDEVFSIEAELFPTRTFDRLKVKG